MFDDEVTRPPRRGGRIRRTDRTLPADGGRNGLRAPNHQVDPDSAQDDNQDTDRAARQYIGPPRFLSDIGSSFEPMMIPAKGFADICFSLWIFVVLKNLSGLVLTAPSLTVSVTLVCLSMSGYLRNHAPDDLRYALFRQLLRIAAFFLILGRLVFGWLNGSPHDQSALLLHLPEFMRQWGDLDFWLRILMRDVIGFLLAAAWIWDGLARAALEEHPKLSHQPYLPVQVLPKAPPRCEEFYGIWALWLAPIPVTKPEMIACLAYALVCLFFVCYVVAVETTDVAAVARFKPHKRGGWFAKYSDRRYSALDAISGGLPRLAFVFACGVAACGFMDAGPYGGLIPVAAIFLACLLMFPGLFGLGNAVFVAFLAERGEKAFRPGVFRFSEAMRSQEKRFGLVTFAVYSTGPFLFGCLTMVPPWPKADAFGLRWPEFSLVGLFTAFLLTSFGSCLLLNGILRACYGQRFKRFFEGEEHR